CLLLFARSHQRHQPPLRMPTCVKPQCIFVVVIGYAYQRHHVSAGSMENDFQWLPRYEEIHVFAFEIYVEIEHWSTLNFLRSSLYKGIQHHPRNLFLCKLFYVQVDVVFLIILQSIPDDVDDVVESS
ncbi:hypothetical protein Dimus_029649, partial [Dionaea muscipula]